MLAAALCGCNVVMTKTPLFTQADAAGAPPLRPGVWSFFREPGCAVDERAPFTDWPDCAGGGLVTADGDIAGHKSGSPGGQLEHAPIVLAAGDPRVLQIQVDMAMSVSAEASGGGAAETSSSSAQTKAYGYAGVRPTKFDDQGRIVAFTLWPAQCGPPPPKNAKGEDVALATLKPLPGIEMQRSDVNCTTHSAAALRNAAKASEAWADELRRARWLRDGDR